jgi:hypothetical protein
MNQLKKNLGNNENWDVRKVNLAFLFLLIGIFFFLGFQSEFFLGPKGIHFIRQVDSLSFVYGYSNNGYIFFQPELFDLSSKGGKAACEFPILYYIVALSFNVFGQKIFLLKLINLLIAYTGIFYLFRLLQDILKDKIYALLVVMLLFTSTVFNYYSFNYLPDTAALGFCFIGWYYINRFKNKNENTSIILSFLFFALSGLLKITYLIHPIAILGLVLFTFIFKKLNSEQRKKILKTFIYSVLTVLIVFLWNWYILAYNSINQSTLFNTKPLPIWALSSSEIDLVWSYISEFWYTVYFAPSTLHLLLVLIVLQALRFSKIDNIFSTLIIFSLIGIITFSLLFYQQFKDHDYYALIAAPLVIFLFANGIIGLRSITNNRYVHIVIKLIFSIIAIVGINYSRMKLDQRFHVKPDNVSRAALIIQKNLTEIIKLNIPLSSKVIIGPEESLNGSLLFLNRKGWSIFYKNQIDSIKLNQYKGYGAGYLFLMTEDEEKQKLANSIGAEILRRKNLHVYKF